MLSFYTLPSTVMHHPQHKQLKAAYSFYNVSNRVPLVDLMQDALVLAKQVRYTVIKTYEIPPFSIPSVKITVILDFVSVFESSLVMIDSRLFL